MEITIQDTIREAVRIRGLRILKEKKRLLILLEDLSPTLTEEREFLEKVYQDEVGTLLSEICLSEGEARNAYLAEADACLEERYGLNRRWRERLFSYFEDLHLHRAVFRILSRGEERRSLEVYVPDGLTGAQVSKHLPPGPLLKLLYHERKQKLGVRNLTTEPWTIIGPDTSRWECPPGRVQALEQDMRICILPRTAQINVIEIR